MAEKKTTTTKKSPKPDGGRGKGRLKDARTKLTANEESFVQEIMKGKTRIQAYKDSTYTCNTDNDRNIDKWAYATLRRPKVQARLAELREEANRGAVSEAIATRKMIMSELAAIAFSNGTDYAQIVEKTKEIDGQKVKYMQVEFIPTKDVTPEKRKAIQAIQESQYGMKVSTYNKIDALKELNKMLGYVPEQEFKLSGKVEVEAKVETDNPLKGLTTEELKKALGI